MDKKIYEAIKKRVSVVPMSELSEEDRAKMRCTEGCIVYMFNADGLNEGIRNTEDDYIDSIIHPMHTNNMWNVVQRFYKFLRWGNTKELNNRLLWNTK